MYPTLNCEKILSGEKQMYESKNRLYKGNKSDIIK